MINSNRLMELRAQGFYCSQILILCGLEEMGKENPDLVRAVHGLAGGLGFSGELCGALTGGACLLGLYAGKGNPSDEEDPRLIFMTEALVDWFRKEYGEPFGGIRCEEILDGDQQNQIRRCPIMVAGVLKKAIELLEENGFNLSGKS